MLGRQNKSTLVQCFMVVSTAEKNALKGFGNLGEKTKVRLQITGSQAGHSTRGTGSAEAQGRSMCGGSRSSQVAAVVGAQCEGRMGRRQGG